MNSPQYRVDASSEYAEAFGTIRAGKNLFWWVVGLSILIQLAGFVLVDFVGIVEGAPQMTAAATAPAASGASVAEMWYNVLCWALPATKFLALMGTVLLVVMVFVGLQVSLVGHLGGAAGMVGSLIWSVLLLAMLTPWQNTIDSTFICGATFNLKELVGTAPRTAIVEHALYYGRFLVFPVIALIVWLYAQLGFARGFRAMTIPPEVVSSQSI